MNIEYQSISSTVQEKHTVIDHHLSGATVSAGRKRYLSSFSVRITASDLQQVLCTLRVISRKQGIVLEDQVSTQARTEYTMSGLWSDVVPGLRPGGKSVCSLDLDTIRVKP